MIVETDTPAFKAIKISGAMRAPGRGTLDPITVLLCDMGGRGRIIVECFGEAWAHYFGSIGKESLRDFVAGCDEYYLADKLISHAWHRPKKSEEKYLQDIARAVIAALKGDPK